MGVCNNLSKTDKQVAENIRKHIIEKIHSLGNIGGHVASPLSMVDIVAVLFNSVLNINRADFKSEKRNRFILSKGHGALAYYAALYETDIISKEKFDTFEINGGDYPGQPSKNIEACIEYSGGSLGLGLSYASGLALSKNCSQNNIYVLMGDGELNEGSVWESAMFAGYNNLKNITVIVDYNKMQSDGFSKDILNFDIHKMWQACGWDVLSCNGHSIKEIKEAFETKCEKPKVIIASTVKGYGLSFIENNKDWHHNRITDEQYEKAMMELLKRSDFDGI